MSPTAWEGPPYSELDPVEYRPLSPAQEEMFSLSLAAAEQGNYIEQVVVRLREPFEASRFIQRWRQLLQYYSVLRTSFHWKDLAEPVQRTLREVALPVTEEDWRGITPVEQRSRLEAFLGADRARPFVLSEAPLMRLAILRFGELEYTIIWTVHHLLVDGRSIRLLLQQAFSDTGLSGDEGAPFGAYIDWLRGQPAARAREFWQEHLAGCAGPDLISLPRPSSPEESLPPRGSVRSQLPETLTGAMRAFAAREEITVNVLLLGAWALLMHRYAGAQDLVTGATKSVRNCPPVTDASVGLYINTLSVRTRLDGAITVSGWLRGLREQWVALREVEHASPRNAGPKAAISSPGYETCFVFERQTINDAMRALGGAWETREVRLLERTPVPLLLAAYGGDAITLHIEYDARRYTEACVARMPGHLQAILAYLVDNPAAAIARMPALPEAEWKQLVHGWQPLGNRLPPACLHTAFERAAADFPDATALESPGCVLTYAECLRRANAFAAHLQSCGVGPGSRTVLCMPRSAGALIAMLGILKSGSAYVPMDPANPDARLKYFIDDAKPDAIVTSSASRPAPPAPGVSVIRFEDVAGDEASAEPGPAVDPSSTAYIIYTSGSTGLPKGICVQHQVAAEHIETMRALYGIGPGDRMLHFASLGFDTSIEQAFVALATGATLVIADPAHCEPAHFSRLLQSAQIQAADLPPAFWRQWVESGIARDTGDPVSPLRVLLVGGDVMPADVVRLWQQHPATARVRLINAYGPTETVMTATCFETPPGFGHGGESRVPIGRPLPGTQAYIADSSQNLLPVGVAGELLLGGTRLAKGYLNRDALTRARFIPNPYCNAPGARLYRSGDRARLLEDGNIEFLGRIDEQIKIRGFRIEPGELEARLREYPGVAGAVVRCIERRAGDPELVAYLVPRPPGIDRLELRQYLRSRVPEFMLPAAMVVLDALPMAVNGKVDYQALPIPGGEDFVFAGGERAEIQTPLEHAIANAWSKVLGIAGIGALDNFFDLGGNSLTAAQVIVRLREECVGDIPPGALFLQPTITGLAGLIERAARPNSEADPCLVPLRRAGGVPLFCALGAGGAAYSYGALATRLGPAQAVYGLQYSHLPDAGMFGTVEDLAARYLTAIRSVQTEGPYYLAGWSFGGIVAYEIARQLLEAGEAVALLALIDCEAHGYTPSAPRNRAAALRREAAHFARRFRMLWDTRDTVAVYARDFIRIAVDAARGKRADQPTLAEYLDFARSDIARVHAMKQAGQASSDSPASRLGVANDQFVRTVVAGQRANERAAARYTMRPYPGKITLFRTAEGPGLTHERDPTLGYHRLAPIVDIRHIEGEHLMVVRDPYVAGLARQLQACINAAREAAE